MIRQDGKFEFYIIKAKDRDGKIFTYNADKMPSSSKLVGYEVHTNGLTNGFEATGVVWQQTGVHGTYSLTLARNMALRLIQLHWPTYGLDFLVYNVAIEQSSREIYKA